MEMTPQELRLSPTWFLVTISAPEVSQLLFSLYSCKWNNCCFDKNESRSRSVLISKEHFFQVLPLQIFCSQLVPCSGPLTSLGQIHSWHGLHSNQQDSCALQWIMILISGAKLMRDCSHHLGQWCFSFWLQGRQGFTLQHSHVVSLALGTIHHGVPLGTETMWPECPGLTVLLELLMCIWVVPVSS